MHVLEDELVIQDESTEAVESSDRYYSDEVKVLGNDPFGVVIDESLHEKGYDLGDTIVVTSSDIKLEVIGLQKAKRSTICRQSSEILKRGSRMHLPHPGLTMALKIR